MLYTGPIKFLYNSKFDFTAKSLVTNTVVIARVLCIILRVLAAGADIPLELNWFHVL